MSFLSDKYNLPQETVKKMISGGVISCCWVGYEEVYKLWKEGKSMSDIALTTGRSKSSVFLIIQRFKNS